MFLLNIILYFWGFKFIFFFFIIMDMIYIFGRFLMLNRVMINDDFGVLYRKDVVREFFYIRGFSIESIIILAIVV